MTCRVAWRFRRSGLAAVAFLLCLSAACTAAGDVNSEGPFAEGICGSVVRAHRSGVATVEPFSDNPAADKARAAELHAYLRTRFGSSGREAEWYPHLKQIEARNTATLSTDICRSARTEPLIHQMCRDVSSAPFKFAQVTLLDADSSGMFICDSSMTSSPGSQSQ